MDLTIFPSGCWPAACSRWGHRWPREFIAPGELCLCGAYRWGPPEQFRYEGPRRTITPAAWEIE